MSIEQLRSKYEALAPFLDERQKRLWAGAEALAIGRGGISRVARASGLAWSTVKSGIKELQAGRDDPKSVRPGAPSSPRPAGESPADRRPEACGPRRVRRPGAGAKLTEVKDPAILATLETLLENEVAGDPMGERKWVRTTLRGLK